MHKACIENFEKFNAAIMCAAVADYTPTNPQEDKIKRGGSKLTIELTQNPDIASDLGKIKKKGQLLVGFALETSNGIENATAKLKKKNLDFIVLNALIENESGFNTDTNKVSIISSDTKIQHFELKSKQDVAIDIIENLCQYWNIQPFSK